MMKHTLLLAAVFFTGVLFSQRKDNPLAEDLRWRNIGPSNMMGRISDIDALQHDYRHVICASASGGVFRSTNGGITWEVIFDQYGSSSIGSVALNQTNPNIIWVGTGEAANRNSSGWGDGLYKSEDGGRSWRRSGLVRSHHIADIALDPTNPNVAYVAVVGHLWGYSGDRGLYKTSDGGQSWTRLLNGLPNDGKTGCTEVVVHPENPNIVFAGFYHRLRQPWHYTSGGESGGLFKSTDGGRSWRKLQQGLPQGQSGMIDLSVCLRQPNIMVAAIEADEKLPEGVPGSGIYRSDDQGESWTFLLKHNLRPFYHGQVEIDPADPHNLYVVSRDFRISRDGGKTFQERDWNVDGGDDHAMWIAPYDSRIFYLGTDQGLRLSVDGGQTMLSFNNMAIGQYYAIGADLRDPYWVGGGLQDNGLWIGPSNSREWRGILNEHNTWVGEGDGFHFQVDPTDWRTLYLVNHVGFAARVNLETREHTYITPSPQTITNYLDYFDPSYPDSSIRYTIEPGEHWFYYEFTDRIKLPAQFRFNWSSPLVLSPHHPQTVYFGGNHLFRSRDRGESWQIISPDLTTNRADRRNPSHSGYLTHDVTGGENHCTIVTVAESPLNERVLWVGTDDGLVQVSKDGGHTWAEVGQNMAGLNQRIWVSRVEPSRVSEGRCYLTLDNHRQDDMKPYVLVTEDYGLSWTSITADLPANYSCYVVREDPVNPNLLFVGTETAVFFSTNRGKNWQELMSGMPTVAIYDLLIHPREGDLIAGTHGRSIWILDDLSPLRQWHDSLHNQALHVFESPVATQWQVFNTGRKQPYFEFRGDNPRPGALIQFWLPLKSTLDSVEIRVEQPNGQRAAWKVGAHPGINRTYWDFQLEAAQQSYQENLLVLKAGLSALETKVLSGPPADSLRQLRKEVDQLGPTDVEAYEQTRERVVEQFGTYGYPLGGRVQRTQLAPAGEYKLTVSAGGLSVSNRLRVRKDPLLSGGS